MSEIDLAELERGFTGRPYSALIQHHLRSQEHDVRLTALKGHMDLIPLALQSDMGRLTDRWDARALEPEFWKSDCGEVLTAMVEDARGLYAPHGIAPTDEQLFNVFNTLTLGFAAAADSKPEMRALMGIREPRLFTPSGLALLYPLTAATYVLTVSESVAVAVGYGLGQLGYLLLVAGLVSGTFRVFNLSRRWQVFLAAVVTWMLGTMLSNLDNFPG